MKTIFLLFILLFPPTETQNVFNRISQKLSGLKGKPISEITMAVARELIGTPYVANTLESPIETLKPNLSELDCVTFVDQSIAIARIIKQGNPTYPEFLKTLKTIRYRNGEIKNYVSRLHYTSELFSENLKNNIWTDVNKDLGGVPFKFSLSVMSQSSGGPYNAFNDTLLLKEMLVVEKLIVKRKYYYFPRKNVADLIPKLKDGDVIMLASSEPGLDFDHLGFAIHQKGNVYLLHASSAYGKVAISKGTFAQYMAKNTSYSGIMVGRLKD